MKIRLFVKKNEISESIRNELEEKLVNKGYTLTNNNDYELAIAIGGDGKFISMLHDAKFKDDVKYVSINTGNLGYLASYEKNEINTFIDDLCKNNFNVVKIPYLSIKVNSDDEYNETNYKGINEVVLRNSQLKTVYLNTFINNNLLTSYEGDGICISSTPGSGAYNMSLGGAIADPDSNILQIIPIAPINSNVHRNVTNPFITSNKKKIIVKPINKSNSISLIIDGKITHIKNLISLEVKVEGTINVIKNVDYNSIININNKLMK